MVNQLAILIKLVFTDHNGLKCIVRSHAEIREGCGLSHEGCYTVYSAPNQVMNDLDQNSGVPTV